MTDLCGGQHSVFVQAEDSIGHNGLIGQEAAAHDLQGGETEPRVNNEAEQLEKPDINDHLANIRDWKSKWKTETPTIEFLSKLQHQ